MTDRAKLEEAIAYFRLREANTGMSSPEITLLAAAESWLATLPKTKMVEVWRVEYAQDAGAGHWRPSTYTFSDEASAREYAKPGVDYMACFRVTGPHLQEVPA